MLCMLSWSLETALIMFKDFRAFMQRQIVKNISLQQRHLLAKSHRLFVALSGAAAVFHKLNDVSQEFDIKILVINKVQQLFLVWLFFLLH